MSVHVVVGPPCAGKSTFVATEAAEGALRVDFDAIALALGSSTPHAADGHVREAAFAARDALVAYALDHPDEETWIIHTSPSDEVIQTYSQAGAEFHLLDPGFEECNLRAKADARPERTAGAIERWYASPPTLPAEEPMEIKAAKLRIRLALDRSGVRL